MKLLWISLIILLVLIVCVIAVFSSINIRQALYSPHNILHFTYGFNSLCHGSNTVSAECPHQINLNIYGPIRWVNPYEPDLIVSLFITSGTYPTNIRNYNVVTENYWITMSHEKSFETYGAIRWSSVYKNRVLDPSRPSKTNVPYLISEVAASSGPFQKFNKGKIFYDYRSNQRHIYIFKNNIPVDPNLISRPSSPPVKTT